MSYDAPVANKENFTFRFDPDLIARIDVIAKKEHRSRTNMIEVMADEYLRVHGVPLSPDPDSEKPLPQ